MTDCLFCKIATKQLNADLVYEDDQIVAFRDIAPQAPCHILIIPRRHIATLNDLDSSDTDLIGKMVLTAKQLAASEGLSDDGYRLNVNCNHHGGQTVFHLHLHLLGGRQMHWPPG